jgi:hypothetical protein
MVFMRELLVSAFGICPTWKMKWELEHCIRVERRCSRIRSEGMPWEWIFGKFLAGLGAQYARAGIWSGPEANRIPPVGGRAAAQALYAYLSLGTC